MLDYEIPEVEMEDGSLQSVLELSFPDGQSIQPCCINDDKGEPCVIPCTVTFQSSSPVSFTTAVVFTDRKERYHHNKYHNSEKRQMYYSIFQEKKSGSYVGLMRFPFVQWF